MEKYWSSKNSNNQDLLKEREKFEALLSDLFYKNNKEAKNIKAEYTDNPRVNEEIYQTLSAKILNLRESDDNNRLKECGQVLNQLHGLKFLWNWDLKNAHKYLTSNDWSNFDESTLIIAKTFKDFSEKFIKIFHNSWMRLIKDENNTYQEILSETFCKILEPELKKEIESLKKFDLNKLKLWDELLIKVFDDFSEDEIFDKRESWIWLLDMFVNIFSQRYPLASKWTLHKVKSKNFYNSFLEWEIEDFRKSLTTISDEIIEVTESYLKQSWKYTPQFIAPTITWNFIVNYPVSLEFYKTNLGKDIMVDFVNAIEDTIKNDHEKKANKLLKDFKFEWKSHEEISTSGIWMKTQIKEPEEVLSDEQKSYINELVAMINKDNRSSRKIYKYLRKIIAKDYCLDIDKFKEQFDINSNTQWLEEILFNKLNISRKDIDNSDTPNWDSTEKKKEISENEVQEIIENNDENEEIVDSVIETIPEIIDRFIVWIQNSWFVIDNENRLRKRISEFCKNWTYKSILINFLNNSEPWDLSLLKHKRWHKNARAINIWTSWWRLLLENKNWKFYVNSFRWHNDYLKRLNMI